MRSNYNHIKMKKLVYLLAAGSMAFVACQNSPSYKVTGSVEDITDGDTIYLQEYAGGNLVKLDSAIVKSGTFVFTGKQDTAVNRYITFIYVTHDQEEALTLSDTIVVMSEGKIQQIGTPVDIYNEPINSFVADFIGESNILNGTMIQDKLVRFAGVEFECVDEGFGENMPVDVVVRPEDWYIFPDSDASQLSGIVTSSIFKGVHYEMVVEANGYEFIVQDYHHFAVGEQVGLLIKPFDIHIMKKERVCNTFEGELADGTHVEFLGCTFECLPVADIEPGAKVKVQVDFKDIILQDNEEDGTLTGDVRFILYKGDHYHLTVSSDWGEDIFVDTNDVWDNGDHVGISILPESIKVTQVVES